MSAPTPPVQRLLETAIQVESIPTSAAFYERVFGFPRMVDNERLCAMDVCGSQVLLLFAKGQTEEPLVMPGGVIPGHGSAGRLHLAFAIDAGDLEAWETRLTLLGIPIEGRCSWERGGVSLYFRDPDEHLVELVTPGIWANY